ncbi:MAG TPA: VOC family protein [Alphaproteobacteria bacterium]|nr:VOC family protein [Alphaproteobacteria bacterium]
MIKGGNVTIFISNMGKAVDFYTNVLGLKLAQRYGDHWASISAGPGLSIGLHPKSPNQPAPGTAGSIQIGLECSDTLDKETKRLESKGIKFTKPAAGEGGASAYFTDPDGNTLYLWAAQR